MFISQVVLENFQAFERGEFNLSPNLNILVGISNVGKSSVARALSLVLFNQWDKSWVRAGCDFCRVTLKMNSGVTVVREKGPKVNKYILSCEDADPITYENFGTAVPEQVQVALGIHTVQVDTTDTLNLNLAGQMDALFLLSQTGSYRAKVFGKLSGATYLDHAIRELNKDKRQLAAEKNSKDLEVSDLQVQIDKYSEVEKYTSTISNLEARLTSVTAAEQRLEHIRNLLERVKVLRDSWTRVNQKIEILNTLDTNLISTLSGKVDKIKAISDLFNRAQSLRTEYLHETKLQELLKQIDLSGINQLAARIDSFKAKEAVAVRLLNTLGYLALAASDLQQAEQDHAAVAKQYADMLRDAGVCPICNRTTVDSCVQ